MQLQHLLQESAFGASADVTNIPVSAQLTKVSCCNYPKTKFWIIVDKEAYDDTVTSY